MKTPLPTIKNGDKKEIIQRVTDKRTSYLHNIEREKRQKRREELREQVVMIKRRMATRETKHEVDPSESGNDRK